MLISSLPELNIVRKGNQLYIVSVTITERISEDPESFLKSVHKVVLPIRKAMSQINNENRDICLNKDDQIKSVPIQLLTLIGLFIDGIEISNQGFSKAVLTIAQNVMYNFQGNKVNTETQYQRHLRCRETSFPIYASIKVYSSIRSKTMMVFVYTIKDFSK